MSTHNLCFIAKNVKVIVDLDVKVLTCTHNLCFEQKKKRKKRTKDSLFTTYKIYMGMYGNISKNNVLNKPVTITHLNVVFLIQ